MDDILIDKSKYDFIVYQGHHGDINIYNADLVLPGVLPYEKQSTFINLYGFVQKSENILVPLNLINVKNDWEIIKGLGDFLGLKIPFFSYLDFQQYFNKFLSKNNFLLPFSSTTNADFNKNYLFFNNYPLSNFTGNYYLTNSISRASLVMGLCAYRFKFTNFY